MLSEPHSGYDLKKEFDGSLRNFWNAELSQIYPQLRKMEKAGLLTSSEVASPAGPPRRVYKRSAKGRRELVNWLNAGPQVGEERLSFLAQVYFLSEYTDPDEAIAFMQALRKHVAGRLEKLQAIEREWSGCDPRYPDKLPDAEFYAQLTLALGLKKVKATLDWCEGSIERIKKRRA